MDCLSARVQRSNRSGSHDGLPFPAWALLQIANKPRLAGASTTGNDYRWRSGVDGRQGFAHTRRVLVRVITYEAQAAICRARLGGEPVIKLAEPHSRRRRFA